MALTHDPSRSLLGRKFPCKEFGIPSLIGSRRHLRSHSNNPTDKVCPGRPIGTVGFSPGNITTLCLTYPDHRNPDFMPVKSSESVEQWPLLQQEPGKRKKIKHAPLLAAQLRKVRPRQQRIKNHEQSGEPAPRNLLQDNEIFQ